MFPWYLFNIYCKRAWKLGHYQSIPQYTAFSIGLWESSTGYAFLSSMTLHTVWLSWNPLKDPEFPSPTPNIKLQVLLVLFKRLIDCVKFVSNWRISRRTNVNGLPIRDYLPKVESGYETPIYDTPILCSLTPERMPIHPIKPIFIHVFPYFLSEGW